MIYGKRETTTHWVFDVNPPGEFETPVAVPDENKEVSYLRAKRKGSERIGVVTIAASKKWMSKDKAEQIAEDWFSKLKKPSSR